MDDTPSPTLPELQVLEGQAPDEWAFLAGFGTAVLIGTILILAT